MSIGEQGLGEVVLRLTTDAGTMRPGFAQARALAARETEQLKRQSRIQLQADLLRLRADFNQAQREAASARRLIEMQARVRLQMDLAQFRSDLRTAEREQAASARRMQQQSAQLGGIGGAIAGGFGIGTGLGLVEQAIGGATALFREGVGVVTQYNASVQSAEALIRGFTRSTFAVAEAQRLANQAVADGRGGYQETLAALASLTPLSRKYGESLEEVLKTAQLLAAIDPVQGFEGAKIALQEALSGDFTSLQRRFELPRGEIQKLKDQGVPNLQIVQRTLAGLGITQELLTEQTGTWNQQLRIAADLARRAVADIGRPAFGLANEGLGEFIAFMRSGAVQRVGKEFSDDLRDAVATLRDFFDDPDNRQIVIGTASGLGELGGQLRDLTALAGPLLGVAHAIAVVGNALDALGLGIADVLGRVGPFPFVAAIENLRDLLNDPQVRRFLDNTLNPQSRSERRDDDSFAVRLGALGAQQGLDLDQQGALLRFGQRLRDSGQDVSNLGVVYNRWIEDMERAGYATGTLTRLTEEQIVATNRLNTALQGGVRGGGRDERVLPTDVGGSDAPFTPAPTTAAIAPESEAQFDIVANVQMAEAWAAAFREARAELAGFTSDWDSELFGIFDELAPRVRSAFDRAFGELDLQQQFARGLGDLDTLTGRMVEDIANIGRVSDETATIIRDRLGVEAGNAVIALANEYGALAAAADRVKSATAEVESAQEGLTAAQRAAADNAQRFRDSIDGLQRDLSALSREASDVARDYADRLVALRDERDAAEALAEAHRRSFQAQIEGLESVRRAREKDEAVEDLTAEQDRTLLDFEQRIRAARRRGGPEGEREARALEQARDEFLARSRYALDLASLEARVARDTADREAKTIQDQADTQAEKDQEAIDAIDERISALEDEAAQVARDYEDRQRKLRDLIDQEEERARVVAAADRQAIADAQTRLTNAQNAKKVADDELTAQNNKVTALERQNSLLDTQLGKWREFIDYLRGLGIDVAKFFNGTGATGVGLPAPPPAGGGTGPNGGLNPGGDTLRAPRYTPPTPPAAYVGGYALRGGGGASALRAGGGVSVQGNLVNMQGVVIRETADVDAVMRRAADLAQTEILEALRDDERSGGTQAWGTN